MRRLALVLLVVTTLAACTGQRSVAPQGDVMARARALAERFIIVDGHIDLPYRFTEEPWAIAARTDTLGDFDFVRARAGGLDAPFMSIYIPAAKQAVPGAAKAFADSLIDLVERYTAAFPSQFEIARSPADVVRIARAGKVALPMGMENGAPLNSLEDVRHFHRRGIRYVTLTHGRVNQLGDSSYDSTRTWHGLSPFGREVVREMNRLGIMVDISHVSDETAFDALRTTRAPVIASHSSMRRFTPGWERNMSDSVLAALGRNGGVVMINFGSAFLKTEYQAAQTAFQLRLQQALRAQGLTPRDRASFPTYYAMRRREPVGTVQDVADHIDHAVRVAGIDHVGLGSDFDGVTSLPAGLTNVSMFPNLVAELLRRGYSEQSIEKILGGNLLRVWREVERVAAASR
ncbi:MAG TPA: dipeptidase [Rhodothermales bacterium]|nr:dipeptidase [Rhodothermales bacterium]